MTELLLLVFPLPWIALWIGRKNRSTPIPDMGVFLGFFVLLYGWLPFLGIYLHRQGIGDILDTRYEFGGYTDDEVFSVGLAYFLFLLGFAFAYRMTRRYRVAVQTIRVPEKKEIRALGYGLAFVFLTDFVVRTVANVPVASSYIESYTVLRDLPLILQQLIATAERLQFTFFLALMVFSIARAPSTHRLWIVVVAVILAQSAAVGGSRSGAALCAVSYLLCYTILVRRIKPSTWVTMSLVGIALFLLAGQIRGGVSDTAAIAGLQSGEFTSVFINALDIIKRKQELGSFDVPLYTLDLARVIPQQLLWFDKLDPSVWYVSTFYPDFAKAGGGLAFGAIAESFVGFGVVEALVRGMLLGLVAAFVVNHLLRERVTPMRIVAYIWLFAMSYQSVRDTTFTLFGRYVFQVLPMAIYLHFMASRLRHKTYRNLRFVKSVPPEHSLAETSAT
ncbi:hypothetical protein UC34_23460 [Pandoraea vervacti]|uniref:Oligosaccharide repeat unit polymerase n=1 Tax=Pandoraea vervacti TaxID=656178 RepID=A0ABM5T2H7_9BURK|nr:O-antigen polysaccharide polymerase Wzy [Pandoraea vervacti]AJP59105.1 hypothetical protein UC34_23460 [Pandoraea vervacti]